ncbi:MAG: SDR family oxidoreductase [Legionella sp.]|nr:SDR family oxidoreductase [Legionella sp.]
MVKILVTGALGLLGSSLTPYLKSCGHEVIRLSQKSQGDVVADLTNWEATKLALDAVLPDVIVNLAACTNVDECERNPQKAYLLNVRIVEHLAKWIRENNTACHLIQISTDMIYDGKGNQKEDEIILSNYYGFSKYAGELAAATVSSTILRTNFFGPSQCESRTSLSDWLIKSLLNAEPIKVFDDVQFSPLSLSRLVKLLEHVIVNPKAGIYNLGSKEGMSKADFAFNLASALNLNTAFMARDLSDTINFSAYRPKDMCMDSSCFEKAFNVSLPTLQEEIKGMEVLSV